MSPRLKVTRYSGEIIYCQKVMLKLDDGINYAITTRSGLQTGVVSVASVQSIEAVDMSEVEP